MRRRHAVGDARPEIAAGGEGLLSIGPKRPTMQFIATDGLPGAFLTLLFHRGLHIKTRMLLKKLLLHPETFLERTASHEDSVGRNC
jgi:hypothetical protein